MLQASCVACLLPFSVLSSFNLKHEDPALMIILMIILIIVIVLIMIVPILLLLLLLLLPIIIMIIMIMTSRVCRRDPDVRRVYHVIITSILLCLAITIA